MPNFTTHDQNTAPEDARNTLNEVSEAYGLIPNLYGKMAASPALVQGYWNLAKLMTTCTLSEVEQLVVMLTVSVVNRCEYCVAAHSAVNDMRAVPVAVTDAIRDGRPIDEPRLETLRVFTAQVVSQNGWVPEAKMKDFLGAGFTRANLMEVVLAVGMKTMSNYFNHLVGTELDAGFTGRKWVAPRAAEA